MSEGKPIGKVSRQTRFSGVGHVCLFAARTDAQKGEGGTLSGPDSNESHQCSALRSNGFCVGKTFKSTQTITFPAPLLPLSTQWRYAQPIALLVSPLFSALRKLL